MAQTYQTSTNHPGTQTGESQTNHAARQSAGRVHTPHHKQDRNIRHMYCHICEVKDQHRIYDCPQFKKDQKTDNDRKVLVDMCKKQGVCEKCLWKKMKNGPQKCPEKNRKQYCNKHDVSRSLCQCPQPNIMNNATVNKSVLGQVGFNSEIITIRSQHKSKKVLVTFDSYASHSSISPELKDDSGLVETSVGMVDVQHYGGRTQTEGFQCTASIDGVSKPIDFLVGGCQQKLPTYNYAVPDTWIKKYDLDKNGDNYSAGGTNMITIGFDQIFGLVLDF